MDRGASPTSPPSRWSAKPRRRRRRPRGARSTMGSCITAAASVRSLGVANLWADRSASNRIALPWAGSSPPAVVTDPVVCRRAARAHLGDSLSVRADSTLRAVVVSAGGLYFVKAIPVHQSGEFALIAVLNDQFSVLMFLTS